MSSVSQIRINKTPEISEILSFLKKEYYGLSENEIIKMILSKFYARKNNTVSLGEMEYEDLSLEGKTRYNEVRKTPISQLYNI